MLYTLLVIISVFIAACAQMMLKKGSLVLYKSLFYQYFNGWVIGGYAIMFACLVINIYAMSRGVLAKEVCAIESLSYLFVPILSFLFFKEKLSLKKVAIIGLIVVGILVFNI